MRVTFKMDGGFAYFPGLSKPLSINTEQMEPKQAAQIESMIHNSHFFDQPSQVGVPALGAADYRTYTITVEDAQRSHVVQLSDPAGSTALQELIDYFQNLNASQKDNQ
jgi:hypothetical protein